MSRSHACPGSLKTTATRQDVHDIFRSWVKLHPVKMENISETSPARRLLEREPRLPQVLILITIQIMLNQSFLDSEPTLNDIPTLSLLPRRSSWSGINRIQPPIGVQGQRQTLGLGPKERERRMIHSYLHKDHMKLSFISDECCSVTSEPGAFCHSSRSSIYIIMIRTVCTSRYIRC